MATNQEVLLEVHDMVKTFGVTVALNHVDFVVKRGEIRGLIGENGSGKSTVSSIISGIQKPTSGTMTYKGKPWAPASTLEAQDNGICMIVQEAGTIPGIPVADNIFLGHEKMFSRGPLVNHPKMVREAQKLLDSLGIELDASERTDRLSMQQCKLVEIAKGMYWDPEIFIVDETTTALSQSGRMLLYKIMHEITARGKAVLFISHDLEELIEQCDAVTVLRDGKIIGSLDKDEFDPDVMKKMMVGREVKGDYFRNDYDPYSDEVVLKADCITTRRDLMCFDLELHKGEILGIGGLSECGMHTVGKALFGAEKILDGQVTVGPDRVVVKDPETAIRNSIGYTSKDRDHESLGLSGSIRDNIASTGYYVNRLFGPIISFRKEKNYVAKEISDLSLKCASQYHGVNTLSGGNKQKVVFGKWIGADSRILILDCPTRGIDIGVKAAMYQLIYQFKKEGRSILLISEELQELIGMSDRILIMKDGQVTREVLRTENPTENDLIEYMI
jgi:ribose transport system ATP-binding protein